VNARGEAEPAAQETPPGARSLRLPDVTLVFRSEHLPQRLNFGGLPRHTLLKFVTIPHKRIGVCFRRFLVAHKQGPTKLDVEGPLRRYVPDHVT
jgi:hypothetical protein